MDICTYIYSCTHVCVCATNAHVLRGQHLVTLTHRSAVGQAALCSELPGQACRLFRLCRLSVCRCPAKLEEKFGKNLKDLHVHLVSFWIWNRYQSSQKPTNTCRQKAAREWTMPHQNARGSCKNGWTIGTNICKYSVQIHRSNCEALASKRLLRYECFQSSSNSSVDLQGSSNSWHCSCVFFVFVVPGVRKFDYKWIQYLLSCWNSSELTSTFVQSAPLCKRFASLKRWISCYIALKSEYVLDSAYFLEKRKHWEHIAPWGVVPANLSHIIPSSSLQYPSLIPHYVFGRVLILAHDLACSKIPKMSKSENDADLSV